MPLPVIAVWGIVAGGVAIVGGSIAIWKWKAISVWWSGKKLAILGERATGKTTLHGFLQNRTIDTEYLQTIADIKKPGTRLKIDDLTIKVVKTYDVSGGEDASGSWRRLVNEADVVIYLVNAQKLIEGDKNCLDRLLDDTSHIGRWIGEEEKLVFLVATHCDLIPDWDSNPGGVSDRVNNHPAMRSACNNMGGNLLCIRLSGSLTDHKSAAKLLTHVWTKVKQK